MATPTYDIDTKGSTALVTVIKDMVDNMFKELYLYCGSLTSLPGAYADLVARLAGIEAAVGTASAVASGTAAARPATPTTIPSVYIATDTMVVSYYTDAWYTLGSLTLTQTMTNKSLTSPTITGTATLSADLTGAGFLDEDDFASDDANKVASQQSIKAYVHALSHYLGGL